MATEPLAVPEELRGHHLGVGFVPLPDGQPVAFTPATTARESGYVRWIVLTDGRIRQLTFRAV